MDFLVVDEIFTVIIISVLRLKNVRVSCGALVLPAQRPADLTVAPLTG
jgi:hypothetical protein